MTSHEALRAELYEFLEQISLTPGSDWDGAREGILQSCHQFLDKLSISEASQPMLSGVDGMVMVPREPTEAMLNAELGLRTWDALPSYESRRDLRPAIWKAMIAAAPAPAINLT